MKVGDLVRLAKSIGMPRQDKAIGIVVEVQENSKIPGWISVLAYWGPGHKMNERNVSIYSLEVISEGG